jgi:pyridoxal phosphate enzyme (YggS family)
MSTMVSPTDSLAERYARVCDRISRAAERSGRKERDVYLVAVTKNAEPEQIRELIDLGHRDLAENRVQQLIHRAAMVDEYFNRLRVLPNARKPGSSEDAFNLFAAEDEKLPSLGSRSGPIRWHMIGHLQRNKARKIVDLVRLVHSVDSLRIAEELQTIALKRDMTIEVLLQVNCSGEPNKHGCPVPAAIPLAEQIETMINVRLRGVMTLAAEHASERETRRTFARARDIFEEMKTLNLGEGRCNLLSMGMSNDYELAVLEGANVVRVGSAIFGDNRLPEPPEEPEEPEEPDAEEI